MTSSKEIENRSLELESTVWGKKMRVEKMNYVDKGSVLGKIYL